MNKFSYLKQHFNLVKLFLLSIALSSITPAWAINAQAKPQYIPAVLSLLFSENCADLIQEANTFYISPNGDDSNSGLSPNAAWKTLSKVQQEQSNFIAGTQVLFQKGGVWNESLLLSRIQGDASKPIKLGSYCTGNKPVFSALTPLKNWSQLSGNLWQASCQSCPDDLNILSQNNTLLGFARHPNNGESNQGYDYTNSYSVASGSNSQIKSDALIGHNWQGGELVLRNNNFVLDRSLIFSHSGDTITFDNSELSYPPAANLNTAGYGFFIQNHISAADTDGEWVWNPDTKLITLYWSQGNPNTAGFSTSVKDNVLSIEHSHFIEINDIKLVGANHLNLSNLGVSNISLNGVESHTSTNGILFPYGSQNISLNEVITNHTGSQAIDLFFCDNCIIKDSHINNTGMTPGLGREGISGHIAIDVKALNSSSSVSIEGNTVDGAGYIGIGIGQQVTVRNNLVKNYNTVKTDGGGIYIFNTDGDRNVIIEDNLVTDSGASTAGMIGRQNEATPNLITLTQGIYLDGASSNIIVRNNKVIRAGDSALYMNKTAGIEAYNNTFIDSNIAAIHYRDYPDASSDSLSNPGISIESNTIIQLTNTPFIRIDSQNEQYSLSGLGVINNNSYCAPYSRYAFEFNTPNQVDTEHILGFARWNAAGYEDTNEQCDLTLSRLNESNLGPELVNNSHFTQNINGWNLLSERGLISHSNLLGGALLVSPDSSLENEPVHPHNSLVSNATNIGEKYKIRFTSQSLNPEETPIRVRLIRDANPFITVSTSVDQITTSQANEHTIYLDVFEPVESIRLWLTTDSRYLPLVLDQVSVRRVEGDEKQREDLVFFSVNQSETQKTITLKENYLKLNGDTLLAGTQVVIAPLGSLVLFPM